MQQFCLRRKIYIMNRVFYIILISCCCSVDLNAQVADTSIVVVKTTDTPVAVVTAGVSKSSEKMSVYKIKPWVDIPVTVAFATYTIYGMSVIYGRDKVPEAEILALNRNDVNSFDRPVTYNYSTKANSNSDIFFYGSMPLPLVLLLDKNIRKDGLKVGLLFFEAMGTTGVLYTSSAMIANRFRPYAYNPDAPIGVRTSGNIKNSFFAGHPALVATATFFTAKVFSDYHPNMKNKWILYTIAGGAATATGLFRMQGGYHFRTDVIVGVTVGSLVGILIPHLHKNKTFATAKLRLLPNFGNGSSGFTLLYKPGK